MLVAVGERFSQLSLKNGESHGSLNLSSVLRLARAYIRSRLAKRPMLPKDIWPVKAIVTSGSDTEIYKECIKELWGRYPLNLYSSTEARLVAMQLWNYKGMSFVPGTNFLEFIPEDEHWRSRADPAYEPRTLLLDEVEAGQRYEIVFTRPSRGKDDYATLTIRNTSTEPLAGKLTADVLDNATGLSVFDASAAPARAAEVQRVSTRLSAVRLLRYASGAGAIMPLLISNCT